MNDECVEECLSERVRKWQRLALATSSEPFSEEASGEWKWMSGEYAEHKLGLHPGKRRARTLVWDICGIE